MTEISDDEVAEIQWASSEQGKAAVRAAWEKAKRLGLDKPSGRDLDMAGTGAIIYAAYLAAGWDAGVPAEDVHRWKVHGNQENISFNPTGGASFGYRSTIVLMRCAACGDVKTVNLAGLWTLEELLEGGR